MNAFFSLLHLNIDLLSKFLNCLETSSWMRQYCNTRRSLQSLDNRFIFYVNITKIRFEVFFRGCPLQNIRSQFASISLVNILLFPKHSSSNTNPSDELRHWFYRGAKSGKAIKYFERASVSWINLQSHGFSDLSVFHICRVTSSGH